MQNRKYAVLIDGGFIIAKLRSRMEAFPGPRDVVAECQRIRKHPVLKDGRLLRAFFYHAPPATEDMCNPIDKSVIRLRSTPIFTETQRLLEALELEPDFALRLGETFPIGWKLGKRALKCLSANPRPVHAEDLIPDIQQKGVDLRIGLDIARLALKRLVESVVVVTGDSDMVPAFKFARREGLRVYLDHMGHGVRRELRAHADLVL